MGSRLPDHPAIKVPGVGEGSNIVSGLASVRLECPLLGTAENNPT